MPDTLTLNGHEIGAVQYVSWCEPDCRWADKTCKVCAEPHAAAAITRSRRGHSEPVLLCKDHAAEAQETIR